MCWPPSNRWLKSKSRSLLLVIQLSEENVVKDYDSAPSFPLKNLKGAFGRGGGE